MNLRGGIFLPQASILMCTYNNESFIHEAMDSICSISFPDLEIVIMDDCSEDQTYEIIKTYAKNDSRIRLFRNEKNIGTAQSAKRGIERCTSSYIFFAAGDDVTNADRIQRGVEIFHSDPNIGVIVGHCQVIDEHSTFTGDEYVIPPRVTNENICIEQFKRNYCLGACMAIKKDMKIIGKDYVLQLIDDYQLSLEYLLAGYRVFIDRHPLIRYRIHHSNVSNNRASLYQKTAQALRVYDSEQIVSFLSSGCYNDKEIFTAVGIFNLFREKVDEAYKYLLLAQDHQSKEIFLNYENLFYLGVVMWKYKRYDESLRYFLEASKWYTLDPTVYNNIGVLRALIEQNVEEALDMFTKALQLQPLYLDSQRNVEILRNGSDSELKFTERIIEDRLIRRKWYETDQRSDDVR